MATITLDDWKRMDEQARRELAEQVVDAWAGELELIDLQTYPRASWSTANFRHGKSGVVLALIPGGRFAMGVRQRDEELTEFRFEEAKPRHDVDVPSFLLARTPMTVAQVTVWLHDFEDEFGATGDYGTRVSEWEIDEVVGAAGIRLPSEAEWEFACRAGTTTLTYRGDELPDEDMLVDEFIGCVESAVCVNPFGLVGLGGFPELCADGWHPSYDGAPTDGRPWLGSDERVVRGGAIDLSPWQGCDEWVSLLSCARTNVAEAALGVALRPALDLSPS